MTFQNKLIAVTGGASGIGRAAARMFAEHGGAVAILDRDANAGSAAAEEIRRSGGKAEFFAADLGVRAQVETVVNNAASALGGIDVLVNNAGIQRYGTAVSTSEEGWDEVLDANLKSAFLVSKYAIPHIIRRGGGSIVITGSVQSVAAQRNSVAYVVSKHGLLGLTRSMALDFAAEKIRVNCVCPGAIDTPLLRWAASLDANPEHVLDTCNRIHLLGRMGQPEEVARVIVFLGSDDASFVTGSAVMVDGGLLTPVGGTLSQEAGTGGS